MVDKIDHIGIAVKNIEEAINLFRDKIGLPLKGVEVVEDQKVKIAFLAAGESKIELLETTEPAGPIGKFIEKKGEGVHHISFRVKDIDSKLKELKAGGVELIDNEPRVGAGGARIAFLHPKSTGGVLVELCQHED